MDNIVAPADYRKNSSAENYDLVVVGAGVAGLNALYAASQYLSKSARVLLIDQKPAAGGMWNIAYDYVRLHQPHPMFTVSDMKWNWDKPGSYLAARDEVQGHLARCLGRIAETVDLETSFGHTVMECEEVATDGGYRARVTYHPNDDPGKTRTVMATRAIFAPGINYRKTEPIALSSKHVVSIAPHDLRNTLAANPDVPVYVVGGGKTGMDTVVETLNENPRRMVYMADGPGTNFLNRNRSFPTGLRRWFSGQLVSSILRDVSLQFDGSNGANIVSYFRQKYSIDPAGRNTVYVFGLLSEEEQARIVRGLAQTYNDYLVDIDDAPDGLVMRLRSGATVKVERGSIVVNCTGSIFPQVSNTQWQPCLSPHDTVLRIGVRDSYSFLPSFSGFFMPHLLYRGVLRGNGFYTIDHEALYRTDKPTWYGAAASQAYLNRGLALKHLPMDVLKQCGIDFDRWYPISRQIYAMLRRKGGMSADLAHCRKSLERLAGRYDLHCAPVQ